jgi:hypothetical protein
MTIQDVSTQFTKSVQFLIAVLTEVRLEKMDYNVMVETFKNFNTGEKSYYYKELERFLKMKKEQDDYLYQMYWNKEVVKRTMDKLKDLSEMAHA